MSFVGLPTDKRMNICRTRIDTHKTQESSHKNIEKTDITRTCLN